MEINKKKAFTWTLFGLYAFLVTQIILVKEPRYFVYRMKETFRRHHFEWIGVHANYKPFRTIWHLLFVDFQPATALLNIGGNILLFIPLGIFLPLYLKVPFKAIKTIAISFLLSCSFEVFQLVTACGFFDVDDILLNTLGGAIGMWVYSWFMSHSKYSQKKIVAAYIPQLKNLKLKI